MEKGGEAAMNLIEHKISFNCWETLEKYVSLGKLVELLLRTTKWQVPDGDVHLPTEVNSKVATGFSGNNTRL